MERKPESEAIAQVESARRFNAVMGKGAVQREYQALARRVLEMGIPQGGKILDVGAGTGYVAIEVAVQLNGRAKVVGMDLSQAMLDCAIENAAARGVQDITDWKLGDAKAMPFQDSEFDLVVSSGSLHHWEDPLAVFNEIARVLKPAGKYLVRDSKRISAFGAKTLAWMIGMTIPADFRKHYWGSIRSSYTIEELKVILRRSALPEWTIAEDILDLMIVKK
jgi:ubiquinone/menaquinone biosynthesis C-methylase UbiE